VLTWDAQLEDVKKEIAKLEDRISALREELHSAEWATDAARLSGFSPSESSIWSARSSTRSSSKAESPKGGEQ